jgi:hypothetical protein
MLHTFLLLTKEYFVQYPEAVLRRYAEFVGGIGVNDDGSMFALSDLIANIIDDRENFTIIAASLERQYTLREVQTEQDHKESALFCGERETRVLWRIVWFTYDVLSI